MNNKGWGLSTMMVLCGIIGFALIVSAVIYQNAFHDEILPSQPDSNNNGVVTTSYKEMETKLVESAIKYTEKYYPNLKENDTIYVSVKQLQVEKLLEELVDSRSNVCSGYISFQNTNGNILYKPYLKCGTAYTTDGYNKSFDK